MRFSVGCVHISFAVIMSTCLCRDSTFCVVEVRTEFDHEMTCIVPFLNTIFQNLTQGDGSTRLEAKLIRSKQFVDGGFQAFTQ